MIDKIRTCRQRFAGYVLKAFESAISVQIERQWNSKNITVHIIWAAQKDKRVLDSSDDTQPPSDAILVQISFVRNSHWIRHYVC
jgi:hypothetical protein